MWGLPSSFMRRRRKREQESDSKKTTERKIRIKKKSINTERLMRREKEIAAEGHCG